MAYISNIPQSTDLFSASQPQILGNFGAIKTLIDINHVDFADATNQGKHNFVSFFPQSSTPTLNNTTDVIAYGMISSLTSQNEIFISKVNQATVTLIQSTASILSTTSAPAIFSSGWTYMPSGILLKWGANISANGVTVITFPTGSNIPAFTAPNGCQTVIAQIATGGTSDVDEAVRLTAVTNTGFTVYGSARTTAGAKAITFTYLAIGY